MPAHPQLIRVTAKTAAEVAPRPKLSEPAQKLLTDEIAPDDYLQKLLSYKLFGDAIRFLSHALPPREAVWWGCLCLRLAKDPKDLPPEQVDALRSAVRWVLQPDEKQRRAAAAAGAKVRLDNAPGCLAHGAFYSGGSLNPPKLPEVLAKPFMTAKTVSGAALLSALLQGPKKTEELQRQFLVLGLGVAMGKNSWESE
jgi:hypothetical protein